MNGRESKPPTPHIDEEDKLERKTGPGGKRLSPGPAEMSIIDDLMHFIDYRKWLIDIILLGITFHYLTNLTVSGRQYYLTYSNL